MPLVDKEIYRFDRFVLDPVERILSCDGTPVPLTPKAFETLVCLVRNQGHMLTKDDLLKQIWPDTFVEEVNLAVNISLIRKALGDSLRESRYIATVPGRGYRFVASVRCIANQDGNGDGSAAPFQAPTELKASSEHETDQGLDDAGFAPVKRQRSLRLGVVIALALSMAAILGSHFWFSRRAAEVMSSTSPSIVVLPFVDMSPGRDQEYFSDGLSEQLIHDLAKVSALKVVGRSSAFQFKGKNEDLRVIGRKLGVATVLEGSVRREGNRVRVTAELTKADDGFQLWSQTYDRKIDDIFAVQDEIARATAEALQLKLFGSNGQPVPSSQRSANPEAYESYLEARYFLGQGHSKETLEKALASANKSINFDARYAPSWALRAMVYHRMAGFSLIDLAEGARQARSDAQRAITLDPTCAAAYLALARVQNDYDWDLEAAKDSLMKAAALEPGSADVVRLQAYIAREVGDVDTAVKLNEEAIALEPLRADFHLGQGYMLYLVGRYTQAQAELQKALDLNSEAPFVHVSLGEVLIAKRQPEPALKEIEKESSDWGKLTGEAIVYHALGREQDSDVALTTLIAKYDTDSAYQIAQAYAFRGQTDKSLVWLERAYKQRDGGMTDIKVDPFFKALRHDPKYIELLKKMHLPI